MNKIFKVKRNAAGQSVVCSEIAKSRTKGRVVASALALMAFGAIAQPSLATSVYSTTAPEVKFDAKDTVLIGKNLTVETETAYNSSNIVIGNDSKVYDLSKSISLGNNNVLGDASTLESGNQPTNAIAVGNDNIVRFQAIGIGEEVEANSAFAIAIGQRGASSNDKTIAGGFGSIAIGGGAQALIVESPIADLTRNIAIGQLSFTNAREAVALGYSSNATGEASTALGAKTNSAGFSSVAIGNGASATHGQSVALGALSETESPVTTSQITSNGLSYTFAGRSSSVVSLGTTGGENGSNAVKRQIVNVAAGRISDSSTDAINGSQLYAAINTLGNLANSVKTELGGNASLATNGSITMTNIGGTGQDTIHDAIAFVNAKQSVGTPVNITQGDGIVVTNATGNGEKTFTVSLAPTVKADIEKAKTDATKGIADAAAAQNTANTAVTKADAAQTTADKAAADIKTLDDIAVKYDSTTKDTITLAGADGTTITNVKDGAITADSKDAVNGGQLFDVYNYVNQGNDAMRQHINTVEDKLQAGIAGSNASAALPQVRGNGKSMMAFGLGGFQDKGALAVGYSRSSDNGRTILKAHLNADTEKQIGGGLGVGFEW